MRSFLATGRLWPSRPTGGVNPTSPCSGRSVIPAAKQPAPCRSTETFDDGTRTQLSQSHFDGGKIVFNFNMLNALWPSSRHCLRSRKPLAKFKSRRHFLCTCDASGSSDLVLDGCVQPSRPLCCMQLCICTCLHRSTVIAAVRMLA